MFILLFDRGVSQMKTMVVSGGANGIGKGIVKHFVSKGWGVATIDWDSEGVEGLLKELNSENLYAEVGDVSKEEDVRRFAENVKKRFSKIDVLVNNAAIFSDKSFFELALEDWEKVISVNLTGYFLMVRYFVPIMKEKGSIINIASTRVIMSEPNNEPYSASKAGIIGLTHALANTLGPRIRVNAINPGWILHEDEEISEEEERQHPCGRAGRIEDIVHAVEFLADNEKSGFITGANIVIDGGMTRKMIYI